ncbi:hypothetical protein FQN54_009936 [Arachnomyces sp. PD_36]|nr:hypothetical protein FQN54_009936 [Arachnomyces sp. PD_36]
MDKDRKDKKLDAGLKSLNHYQQKLPSWRYWPRQKSLPLVRWETPYLAWFQEKMRSPSLDSWFAITANLGTHTFFMVFLPILFWCGYTSLGRGGFLKDLLCLPRPLSPPLQRITMSGSAALEYGFPSTHATNAVSVVVYALHLLQSPDSTVPPTMNTILQCVLYVYATSIVVGRLYCGMHGFSDVIVGSLLGALIAFVQCSFGDTFDNYVFSGSIKELIIVVLIILALVRIHPEPADDCPCFDDSVAFAGVMIGTEVGTWHFSRTNFAWSEPGPGTVPFSLDTIGWTKSVLRILLGVFTIFVWREVMKPSLLRFLPPLFRVIERLGLSLPRRFFTKASEYKKVPGQLKDDNVLPNMSDIPSILTSIRHPRRRAISVGPQSEADAYETLAYREKRRRESTSSDRRSPSGHRASPPVEQSQASPRSSPLANDRVQSPVRTTSKLHEYEHMMGTGTPRYSPEITTTGTTSPNPVPIIEYGPDGQDEKEMFLKITKPRVRYDVEVVTKLIVYSGIALLAVEFNPILFDLVGLSIKDTA